MKKLTINQIIANIQNEELFEAVSADYSFTIKIDNYVPYACGAVHDGHQFRRELWENCMHTEYDRWFEEDPATKEMVQTHPIVIAGIKHSNFYKVVHALISKLEEKFGVCVVYDMHSYNWKRWTREVPTFNLGTSNVDNERFGDIVEDWRALLSKIELPNDIASTSKINDTFQGNGYFLKYITEHFSNTLVLATEVKKIYCDEIDQIMFPEVVSAIEKALKTLIPQHADDFYKKYSS